MVKISASLLASDFGNLNDEVKRAEKAGADLLHCDIMDGHFVPNITFGPLILKAIRKLTDLPLEAHLMIENPENYIKPFALAGSDIIIFHIEATKNPKKIISVIKSYGKKAGISLKPKTKAETLKPLLKLIDTVLVMTVEPGFGGQEFMHDQLPKIKWIRKNFKGDIGVDGGINYDTTKLVVKNGANLLVAGTFLFGSPDMKTAVRNIRKIGESSKPR